ncbi:MAG TPA: helix-turn-helix transcriptional regulator [Umezawaea sp.]|nr:helix-turn-helix transcriptional regulator [Umezawaea sp.]
MAEKFRPTTLERSIGRRLHEWREASGMSLVEVGHRVGFSNAKLSKIENALQAVNADDLLALALIYGIDQPDRHRLYREAQRAEQRRALASVKREVLFDIARDCIELEFEAAMLRIFKNDLVPGPFQTHGYAVALAKADDPLRAAVLVEQRRELWAARKKRLYGPHPLEVQVVLTQGVIESVVGGGQVMKDQLLHLMELGELPNVTLQIMPFRSGAYPGMGSTYDILSFAHELHDDVIYTDNVTYGQYIEAPDDLEPYKVRFAGLQKRALDPCESLELIAEVASVL